MKFLGIILISSLFFACNKNSNQNKDKPNIIIVFTDDQGYQDLGCYGSPNISTPNIDKMAVEGLRYTNFYVSSSICSPSRASLLTGKLPKNTNVPWVFFQDERGMDTAQITIAEVLKREKYRTACFGKWHLGDFKSNLPVNQGFDEYYGIPYSNDMSIGSTHEFSENVIFNEGYTLEKAKQDQMLVKADREAGKEPWAQGKRNCVPIFEDDKIVEYPAEQSTLTKRYFEKTIDFIKKSEDEPFFVYLTPAMPHIPLYASKQFRGKSKRGLYGDVVEEIDYYMGQLLDYLKETGLDQNTIVIYASDNGPWLEKEEDSGSAKPLRGGKFSNYEGGVRVPSIVWYPKKIKENTVSDQVVSTIDILPTLAALTNIDISDLNVDGDVLSEVVGSNVNKNQAHLYSFRDEIWGVRMGEWKYMPHSGKKYPTKKDSAELYNLKEDIGEQNNLIKEYPEKADELMNILKENGIK